MFCKTGGFQAGDNEEWRLLGHKNPVRTSQEAHYVSATEPSRLMLGKIGGFHGGDYEECHLLWYKTPVRTSQETRHVSTTDPSRLMLCKICGFQVDGYEECSLLACGAMWLRVALVRTHVSEESTASTIMVERISELGTKSAASCN
jgi:carbonic anhydrase